MIVGENYFIFQKYAYISFKSIDMNLLFVRYHIITCTMLCFLMCSGCHSHVKKGLDKDSPNMVSADTITDTRAILTKVNALVGANKLEDATACISADLPHFRGADKAVLLNARGDVYILKDDLENALSNYIAATEIDPDNPTYLINVARTYESMSSLANATIFAKRMLDLKTASDSEKIIANDLILRCDRIHSGH